MWLTPLGELKSHNVDVNLEESASDGSTPNIPKSFIYNNKKYPQGVYYLIRKKGREALISESALKLLS
ncbi:hypothetical protein [Sulfuracidifex tepidarius]|uniref:hypothetical protein n=1 Tax=Sulfuracidifex tepidarius TaxID=1294262 RepID=UPI0011F2B8AF|nr:hypothetical protein [Sulfuracidifex tepidarius]